jgi:hypothetical protein
VKFAASFLLCLLVSNTLNPIGKQQQSELSIDAKLDRQIHDFRTQGRTLIATVVDLAYEFQLPIGIEYVDREATTRSLDLEFRDESLRSILAGVVAQLPEYQVAFVGQIVQIYSPRAREDSSNLLNRVIMNFSVVNADTGDAGLELACALSRALKDAAFCGGSIAGGQWGQMKLTLHLQNAKVYEILDTIVAQNGRALWTVTVPPRGLSKGSVGNLWHIYPLESSFKGVVSEKLSAGSLEETAPDTTASPH